MIGWDWIAAAWDVILRLSDLIRSRRAPCGTEEFIESYSEAIDRAVHLLPEIYNRNSKDLDQPLLDALKAIEAAVIAFMGPKAKRSKINMNYMIPEKPTQELLKAASLVDYGRELDSFRCFLVAKKWAEDSDGKFPDSLVVPVEHRGKPHPENLFCGPTTFTYNQAYFVNNTRRMNRHIKRCSPEVQDRIKDYFNTYKDAKSVMTLPVVGLPMTADGRERVIAVINVRCNKAAIFGRSARSQRKLRLCIAPFLSILSLLISKKHPEVLQFCGSIGG